MTSPLTQQYADFIAGWEQSRIPSAAYDVARLGFTDCGAAILAGREQASLVPLRDFTARQGGNATSRILLSDARLTMTQAGLINGTASHAIDYDDFAFSNHPSAVLVPTVLAAADASHASGAEMAAAYIVGYEVWADIMLREPDHLYDRGWHPTAVFGPLGAAAAASVVLGLDRTQARNALAIAASMAGGVFENFGTMAKPFHGGRAAEAGLTAAALAHAGLEASPTALEGRHGLLHALSPHGRVDRDRPAIDGSHWRIVELRLNIKKYPVVGAAQRVIDSVRGLLADRAVDSASIAKIVPRVSERHAAVMPYHRPSTALQAKFSLEFAVACALVHGTVGLAQLRDEIVRAPLIQDLMAKVEIETTSEAEPGWPDAAPFDQVRFVLRDGTTLMSPAVRRARGHADTPLSEREVWEKFSACAAYTGVSPSAAEALFTAMQHIDSLKGSADIPAVPARA